jgi:hypothetical protein
MEPKVGGVSVTEHGLVIGVGASERRGTGKINVIMERDFRA